MGTGRPREWDREEIYLQLNEWCKRPENISINKFCSQLDLDPQKLTDWAKEDESFRVLYRIAKTHIAVKREEMANVDALPFNLYKMHARNYDHFVNQEYTKDKEFDSNLRMQELESQLKLKQQEEMQEPMHENNRMIDLLVRQQAENAILKQKLEEFERKFGANESQ